MTEDAKEKALSIIRIRGPVLPVDIAKQIDTNILLASALLSELVSNGELKISNIKVGGSPLYFLPSQESKLQNYSKYLHEKEQRAYELLKQKKVLRDKAQEPTTRVALRQIKDFAIPLSVKTRETEEIFWKWHTLSNEETSPLIKEQLGIKSKKAEKEAVKKEQSAEQEMSESRSPSLSSQSQDKPLKQEQLPTKKEKPPSGAFMDQLTAFFNKNNIIIIEQNAIRKKTDIEFIVKIPSPVGDLTYYCRAKSKKRANEGDLSTAYVQGQAKKLPVLFLTTGELSKKAKEMLSNEFKNLTVKKIG